MSLEEAVAAYQAGINRGLGVIESYLVLVYEYGAINLPTFLDILDRQTEMSMGLHQ